MHTNEPPVLDFAAAFAALPGATAVFSADPSRFTVLAASDALLAAGGRSREDVVGRTLTEAFPSASPDDPAASGLADLRTSLAAALRTGAPQRMARQRYDLQRSDGRWEERYWDAVNTPVPGPDGTVHFVLHQTVDVTAQVLGEAATARAEQRAEAILERMSDAHCTLDHEFRFVSLNAAAERVLGMSRQEIVGRSHWEVFPWSVNSTVGDAYRRVLTEGVEQHLTHHYTGEGYDLHLDVDAYPTEAGGVAVFWRDVTARVLAEVERVGLLGKLAAERERLRSVILHMPAPLALLEGPEQRFTLVNDAYKRISGAGRDVAGLTTREAFPELVGSGIWELFELVYGSGEPWVGPESPVRYDRDGTGVVDTWLDLRLEPVRDANGQVTGVLNFAVDVTDQVRARREVERLLGESEAAHAAAAASAARAEAVLASIADAFYLLDREWRFIYVNDAAEPLLQCTRAALLGRTLWEAFPGVIDSPFEAPYREAMSMGRVTSAESYFPPLGTWFDVRTYPWEGGLMVHFRDVGARKAAEAERERLLADAEAARVEAEAANRAKSEFLAVMSHELRTPLNAIGGYAELMEMGIRGPVAPQQAEDLRRIQASQRHLLGLINEVLNYAKLETGTVHYDVSDVRVRDALGAAESLVAPQAQAKGLMLTVTDCAADLSVRADGEKLRQILVNLLSNAVKFTDRGGRIVLASAAADALVQVTVRDTGIGIPADKLHAIFDPFVQVRADLTRTAEGTGLGLAISRDLARGMSGELVVDSTPGGGSTFTLTLPRA